MELSKKQLEVLALVAIGRTNEEIAQVLGNTGPTIKNHVMAMLKKLNAFNRVNLVWKAMALGIIKPPAAPEQPAEVSNVREIVPAAVPQTVVWQWRDVRLCEYTKTITVGDAAPRRVRMHTVPMARLFIQHPGRVFSRDQLITEVWGASVHVEERCVDVYVRDCRAALGPYGHLLVTERGLGYKFLGVE